MIFSDEGVSFIICSHNGADRIGVTLSHLAQQEIPEGVNAEVILVNNASTDKTSEVALRSWPHEIPIPLRIVDELELGLGHARWKGFQEARYGIICYVDDDNWIDKQWAGIVQQIFSQYPQVGACGGYCEAIFEGSPPQWFQKHQLSFACGPQGNPGSTSVLWGSGLSIRKSALQDLVRNGLKPYLIGRCGRRLLGGEDHEICLALRLSGWDLWFDPRLQLKHFIAKERFQWSYLMRLMRGNGYSRVRLDPYYLALNNGDGKKGYSWKQTSYIQIIWVFLGLFPKALRIIFSKNSLAREQYEVNFEISLGKFLGLMSLGPKYDRLVKEIKNAPWVSHTICFIGAYWNLVRLVDV